MIDDFDGMLEQADFLGGESDSTKFVVALERRELNAGAVVTSKVYFEIGPFYDPYRYCDNSRGTQTVSDKKDAFKFNTESAAEVIAALYCGRVEIA